MKILMVKKIRYLYYFKREYDFQDITPVGKSWCSTASIITMLQKSKVYIYLFLFYDILATYKCFYLIIIILRNLLHNSSNCIFKRPI